MSPSTLFWIDLLIGSSLAILGMAWVLLVLSGGGQERLGRSALLFATLTALNGLFSTLGNAIYWLDARVLSDRGGFGAPSSWFELTVASLILSSPALLSLAVSHSRSLITVENNEEITKKGSPRRHKLIKIGGFLVSFALMPTVLSHRAIERIFLNQNGLVRLELTALGYIVTLIAFLIFLSALLFVWRSSRKPGMAGFSFGTVTWGTGYVMVLFSNIAIPIGNLALGIGFAAIAFAVYRHHIFDPIRERTRQLEADLSDRTLELQRSREALEGIRQQLFHLAQFTHEMATITDPDKIIDRLVEVIHQGLGFENVYIYKPDHVHQNLIVQTATGTTAHTVVESRHRLVIGGQSIPGQAAAKQHPIFARARGSDASYFEGTALWAARSEIAVPLLVGDHLLAVLDVQSLHFDAFSEAELSTLIFVADEVAIALEKARLFQENQAAQRELSQIHRQRRDASWAITSEPDRHWAFTYTADQGVVPADPGRIQLNNPFGIAHDVETDPSTIVVPITVQGEAIGIIRLRQKTGQTWQSEDVDDLVDLMERIGPALEAARLSEEAQHRSALEQLVGRVTSQMRSTLDMETVLRTAVDEIYQALQLEEVTIQLSSDLQSDLSNTVNGANSNGG